MKTKRDTIILIGAYGKKYNTRDSIIKDFINGYDFTVDGIEHEWCGKLCSIKNLKPGTIAKLYWNNYKEVIIFKVEKHHTIWNKRRKKNPKINWKEARLAYNKKGK